MPANVIFLKLYCMQYNLPSLNSIFTNLYYPCKFVEPNNTNLILNYISMIFDRNKNPKRTCDVF